MSNPKPFTTRPIVFSGLFIQGVQTLKRYQITLPGDTFEMNAYEQGIKIALRTLPNISLEQGAPGVGFVICHQGANRHYIVTSIWGNENELFTRTLTRARDSSDMWSEERDRYSFCVWDLEVFWHERNAYCNTVLKEGYSAIDKYLGTTLSREP